MSCWSGCLFDERTRSWLHDLADEIWFREACMEYIGTHFFHDEQNLLPLSNTHLNTLLSWFPSSGPHWFSSPCTFVYILPFASVLVWFHPVLSLFFTLLCSPVPCSTWISFVMYSLLFHIILYKCFTFFMEIAYMCNLNHDNDPWIAHNKAHTSQSTLHLLSIFNSFSSPSLISLMSSIHWYIAHRLKAGLLNWKDWEESTLYVCSTRGLKCYLEPKWGPWNITKGVCDFLNLLQWWKLQPTVIKVIMPINNVTGNLTTVLIEMGSIWLQ